MINASMPSLLLTDCNSIYCIRDYEEHTLGYALPGDLFVEVNDVSTVEDFDSALQELTGHWDRRCWFLCGHQDEDATELAQRSGFFWLSPGVWFRIGDVRS
jgi:hypothetical protein